MHQTQMVHGKCVRVHCVVFAHALANLSKLDFRAKVQAICVLRRASSSSTASTCSGGLARLVHVHIVCYMYNFDRSLIKRSMAWFHARLVHWFISSPSSLILIIL